MDKKKLDTVESGKEKENGVESEKEEKKDACFISDGLTPNDEDMKEDGKMAAMAKKGSDNDAEFEKPDSEEGLVREEQIQNKKYEDEDDEDMGVLVPREESAANKQEESPEVEKKAADGAPH